MCQRNTFRKPQSLRCSSHPATLLQAETLLFFKRLANLTNSPRIFTWEPATYPLLATPQATPPQLPATLEGIRPLPPQRVDQACVQPEHTGPGYGQPRNRGLTRETTCWHAPLSERSRTDTRDATRLASAGIVPLPGALADGHTRCSRTDFAGTVALPRALNEELFLPGVSAARRRQLRR